METTLDYTLAKLRLGGTILLADVEQIARPIATNYGLWDELEDICQETITRLLEDYDRFSASAQYVDKMREQQYYNKAIRNKVILVCELYSDPFRYYYRPDWVRDNLDRLLDVALTESEAIEVADFKRGFDKCTDVQQSAILNGERSGNASKGISKIVREMNRGRIVDYVEVSTLDRARP